MRLAACSPMRNCSETSSNIAGTLTAAVSPPRPAAPAALPALLQTHPCSGQALPPAVHAGWIPPAAHSRPQTAACSTACSHRHPAAVDAHSRLVRIGHLYTLMLNSWSLSQHLYRVMNCFFKITFNVLKLRKTVISHSVGMLLRLLLKQSLARLRAAPQTRGSAACRSCCGSPQSPCPAACLLQRRPAAAAQHGLMECWTASHNSKVGDPRAANRVFRHQAWGI